jgi:hypothetical protein
MGFRNAWRAAPDSPGNGSHAHSSAACCNPPNNAVTPKNQAAKLARQRLRRQRLVSHLHRLGPSPMFHFLAEIERGASIQDTLEIYATLPIEFVRALGGDKFPPPFLHVIDGASAQSAAFSLGGESQPPVAERLLSSNALRQPLQVTERNGNGDEAPPAQPDSAK